MRFICSQLHESISKTGGINCEIVLVTATPSSAGWQSLLPDVLATSRHDLQQTTFPLSPTPGLSGRWGFSCNPEVSPCFGFDSLVMFLCCSQCLLLNRNVSGRRAPRVDVAAFQSLQKNFGHECSGGMKWKRAKVEDFL